MSEAITLPLWLIGLLIIFAAIGVVDRVFAPGMRWFFRRKVNTAIDELNSRLDMQIRPFKLTRKQSLVDRLMHDQKVIDAARFEAQSDGKPITVAMAKAERYAREIIPSFSPLAYFGFGTRLSRLLSQFIYRVRLGYADDEALKAIDPDSTVVFVMNHRSNMDYVLVTYLASSRASLSYAVGEWARIWGLQSIIRAMGAYFIRRASRNELYRRVLARYVNLATREGVTQAVFPEGGLTKDGKLREPRLGLIGYMLADFKLGESRDIVFIPVGINYDRVLEDRILTREAEAQEGGRDYSVSILKSLGFVGHLVVLRLKGKLYRYGYACVSFGTPVSLTGWLKQKKVGADALEGEKRFDVIAKLGDQLLDGIGQVIPVLPVSLVASVFLDKPDHRFGELELKSAVFALMEAYEDAGAHAHIPRHDRDYAVSTGLRMLTLRKLVLEDEDGLLYANPQEHVLLRYYANAISHLLEN